MPFWQTILKIVISAVVLVTVAEIAKRSSFWAAALASIPLTSLLAFVWLYLETSNTQQIVQLSQGIFWMVLPSLVLFIVLPILLRHGVQFWLSLGIATLCTTLAYWGMLKLLNALGIQL
jgi:hypothetical protein